MKDRATDSRAQTIFAKQLSGVKGCSVGMYIPYIWVRDVSLRFLQVTFEPLAPGVGRTRLAVVVECEHLIL